VPVTQAASDEWVRLIRAEFQELPGLVLTAAQVRRRWDLDDATCNRAIHRLVMSGFLERRFDGSFTRRVDSFRR